jgi:hypothetical protein
MIGFYLHHAQNLNLKIEKLSPNYILFISQFVKKFTAGEEKKLSVSPVEKCPFNFTTASRETCRKSKMSRDE